MFLQGVTYVLIVTQYFYVTQFQFWYSMDGVTWLTYPENQSAQVSKHT